MFINSAGKVRRDKTNNEQKNLAIKNWSASLVSHAEIPIITVGGIDIITGFLDPGSKADSLLTISAPWQTICFTRGGEVDCWENLVRVLYSSKPLQTFYLVTISDIIWFWMTKMKEEEAAEEEGEWEFLRAAAAAARQWRRK